MSLDLKAFFFFFLFSFFNKDYHPAQGLVAVKLPLNEFKK